MIERMLAEVLEEPAKRFGAVKSMAFCKLLYLLEALFSADRETVGEGHLTAT